MRPLLGSGPAHHSYDPRAADLDEAEFAHQGDEAVHLVGRAGQLEHETLGGGVDDIGAEQFRNAQRFDARVDARNFAAVKNAARRSLRKKYRVIPAFPGPVSRKK